MSLAWIRGTVAVVVVVLAPLERAFALPLNILTRGGSLTSQNGQLLFDDFEVTSAVPSDATWYDIKPLVDGLEITTPAIGGAELVDFSIRFRVSSDASITGASL